MGLVRVNNNELKMLTTLVLVLSCIISVLGTYSPVGAPTHPPVRAPKPGHHHKPPAHAPIKPPVRAPVKAPVHAPVKAPVKAPVHAPVKAPVKAPVHAPVKAPVHAPTLAPAHPPIVYPLPIRKYVAVQGVVFCKPCRFFGVDTLLGATPIEGAIVRLECKNTKYKGIVRDGKTDKNGYFYITAPNTITTYAAHKCSVKLVSSPSSSKCKKPTNLHFGLKGSTLIPPRPTLPTLPNLEIFSVGPFAFEPTTKCTK